MATLAASLGCNSILGFELGDASDHHLEAEPGFIGTGGAGGGENRTDGFLAKVAP